MKYTEYKPKTESTGLSDYISLGLASLLIAGAVYMGVTRNKPIQQERPIQNTNNLVEVIK